MIAVALALVTAAACGASDPGAGTAVDPVTDQTSPPFTPGTAPATDSRPILELIDVCYGHCGPVAPASLPSVAVYPDGTIVRSGYETAAGDPQRRLATYAGRLDDGALAALVDEARAADLTLGGVGINGTTQGAGEGTGTRFVVRLDGQETAFEAPFLGAGTDQAGSDQAGSDQAGGDPEQRAALATVADHLRSLARQVAVSPRQGARWVLVAAPSPGSSPDVAWSAPDPATLDAPAGLVSDVSALGVAAGTPLRCAVLDVGDDRVDELAAASDGWWVARVGATVWSLGVRPLLPHEHRCTDVGASVADQHLADLAQIRNG